MGFFTRLSVVVSLLVALVCAAFPVGAVQIVYPEDGTYVSRSNYLMLKGGDGPVLDGINVEVNGLSSGVLDISSPEYKAVFSDFLILETDFVDGVNRVKVEGYAAGKVVRSATARFLFQKTPYAVQPEGYRPYVMHTPQREKLCAACHNMDPTPEMLKQTAAENNPCAACHKKILQDKNVHGPAGVFRCTFCHDSSSKPSKYRSRAADSDICNECHLDKVKEFSGNRYVHGPVAVGLCSVCHDPHATNYPAQLHDEVNNVCLGCHAGLNVPNHFTTGIGKGHPVGGVPDPSRSGKILSCVSCHNPHGGKTRTFFEVEYRSAMMICQKCHRK